MTRRTVSFFLVIVLLAAGAAIAQEQKLTLSGVTYTKWLWGDMRYDGSMYNFTTVPGEGYGDNGQGTELELLLAGKPNKYIEVAGRIHSRFSQNEWTNFGGFGGRNPAFETNPPDCTGGDCGEFDPRSNQYIKLRGVQMRITPYWKYVDTVQIGATDLGMFDAFSIGKIRYIDRDNASAVLFQGSGKNLSYDAIRVSLPRLWAGPNWTTGDYTAQDSAYGLQFKYTVNPMFDFAGVAEIVRDVEVKGTDNNWDDGRDLTSRFKNDVYGIRFGLHPNAMFDIRGMYYASKADSQPISGAPGSFGLAGYSPVPAGKVEDPAIKLDVDIVDPFKVGLSFNVEYFDIGAQYVSMMAARRESDVLLTEGHDGTFAMPGPMNAKFGVFGGNPTSIGYAGWQGNAQQVATINVDNEFTDFDEPMAETVIGWKGFTVVPTWSHGALDLAAEISFIDYNTNWQAWGDPSRPIDSSIYPNMDSDVGVGHNFRNAYAPFQDKQTDIEVLRGKYTADVAKGIDFFGKVKFINETDDRMTDSRFLPYAAGDCPGGGAACAGNKNFYSPGNSTASLYGNPGVITVNGVTGYQWKPFDSVSDDDRDLNYKMLQFGAGYQFTDILYGSLSFERYDVDLKDGNTAMQGYNLHEMSSGKTEKNKIICLLKFPIGGAEAGFDYEYAYGTFEPDFGGGFVPQVANEEISAAHHVPVGSLGFSGRYGGWNSLEKHDYSENHLKAYLKIRF